MSLRYFWGCPPRISMKMQMRLRMKAPRDFFKKGGPFWKRAVFCRWFSHGCIPNLEVHMIYIYIYIHTYIHTWKIHSSFPCWMQCWTRAAVLFLSLLSLGTVVLSHLSQTLSNVWMLVYRYVGLLYTYLDINTASWHVDNCCLHVITNKMLNANCCKRITTLLVKRTLIG